MKGLIRSKLTHTLAALLMIAVAVIVPLSGTFLHSHAAPSSSQASWNIVPSPTPSGMGFLQSISAVSSNDVWAVGRDYNNGSYNKTLIEHWDGASWTITDSPNAGSSTNQLLGVAAASSNDVWAVGNYASSNTNSYNGYPVMQTLILHWDGSSWNAVSSPNASSYDNILSSVTVVSANDVWAVGNYTATVDQYGTATGHTLIEHWDGTSWTVVSDPGDRAHLFGVAAISASDIWAVGATDGTNQQTITEHYDGTSWTIVQSPNVCTGSYCTQGLSGVSAVSANDVWAVGTYHTWYTGTYTSMTMHWDGSSWTMVSSPNVPNMQATLLSGVTAISSSDVWAVGYSQDNSIGSQAQTMHWDGNTWTIVSTPDNTNSNLWGVAAINTNDVWAVGQGSSGTLTEHYTDSSSPTPSPTDTPSPSPSPSPTVTQTVTPSPSPTPAPNPSVSMSVKNDPVQCSNTLKFSVRNTATDEIRISDNGTFLTKLPGNATSYIDSFPVGLETRGYDLYEVSAFEKTHFVALARRYISNQACAQQPVIPPPYPKNPISGSQNDLFVLVQGINSKLPDDNSNVQGDNGDGYNSDFEDYGHVAGYLMWHGYRDSRFIVYSYTSSYYDGMPNSYACQDTWQNTIQDDALQLGKQIAAAVNGNKNIRVHLIGHSLAAAVITTYVAALLHHLYNVPGLPDMHQLVDVNILDGALGGMTGDSRFLPWLVNIEPFICLGVSSYTSENQLTIQFASATDPKHLGQTASAFPLFLGSTTFVPNQQIFDDAHNQWGTTIDVVGNLKDNLWKLHGCIGVPNFLSTEFIRDEGSGVFSRVFSSGNADCLTSLPSLNHGDVLKNGGVNKWVLQIVEHVSNPVGLNPYTG